MASLHVLVIIAWIVSRHSEGLCPGIDHNCSQICIRFADGYFCHCFHGYRLARDGNTCVDIDECTEYRPCHQLCTNTEGGFTCACYDGFTLDKESGECFDIDECLDPFSCNIDGIKRVCVNLPGTHQCIEEIIARDNQQLFDTELLEVSEIDEEYGNSTTAYTIPTTTTAKTSAASVAKTDTQSSLPKCPERGEDSDEGYQIGSAISAYQLSIIAGCFITAVGLIVVFVIVFIVVQMRRKQRSRPLMGSPRSNSPRSTSSLTVTSPNYQWRRNYVRRPDRRSAHRWRPYAHSDAPRDRNPTSKCPCAPKDDVIKMESHETTSYGLKPDDNNNAVIPAFV